MTKNDYDLIVIGGGPGGYVAAIKASQLGMSVALVEYKHLGGICLNWGCIPTKALLRASEIRHMLDNVSEFGFTVSDIKMDINNITKRSRKVAAQLSEGIRHLLKKNKVFVAKRIDNPKNFWQMPQGGVDEVELWLKWRLYCG